MFPVSGAALFVAYIQYTVRSKQFEIEEYEKYLRSNPTLAQILRHQPILNIAKPSALAEMALGQKHIPQPQLTRFGLELFYHGWVRVPALFAVADLLFEERVGWDAFFLDEFLDLTSQLLSFFVCSVKGKRVWKEIPGRESFWRAR